MAAPCVALVEVLLVVVAALLEHALDVQHSQQAESDGLPFLGRDDLQEFPDASITLLLELALDRLLHLM